MTSTLRRQLAEIGMGDRWGDILDELPRVREELGWPIMVTPLSQFVGVQAFFNVTTGERWSRIPDEVVRYVLGQYGPPAGEMDPEVAEKVLASPRADALAAEKHGLDLEQARARFGDAISDEHLLLRMMLPAEQVDAMLAGPAATAPRRGSHPVVQLVRGLVERPLERVEVEAAGLRLLAR
jgi:oxaloacetate decarboxylase alpha subunit